MPLDGEVIKETFYILKKQKRKSTPELPLPKSKLKGCCGACSIKVFADPASTSTYRNDVVGPHEFYPDDVSSVVVSLVKFDHSLGDYTPVVADLSTGTMGTFTALGGASENDLGENFVGIQLDFNKVIIAHGEGSYKVKFVPTSFRSTDTTYSEEYCLHTYNEEMVNGTFRINYYLNGLMGLNEDDLNQRDYQERNWHNALRLSGVFYYGKSAYTDDYTQYESGERPYVKSEQEPEFRAVLLPICWNTHNILRTDVMQSDTMLITDYNAENFARWVDKSVQRTSEYAPDYIPTHSMVAGLELTFRQSANNLKKFRS